MTNEGTLSRRNILRITGVAGVGAVAGCLDDSSDAGNGAGADEPRDDDAEDSNEPIADDWQAETLTDVTTGEAFSIDELEAPVLVHTFATNCLTCASQQDEFGTLQTNRDDIAIIELTTDPDLNPEDIATHAEEEGLNWRVGVPSERVLGALIEEFGTEVSISAQSPVIVICPDGTTDTLSKVASPDELQQTVEDVCQL